MREELESFKQQVTPIPPTTTETASELQVLVGDEPAVVYESKDFSLTTVISDNLPAEVEIEVPAVVGAAIAVEQTNSSSVAIPKSMTGSGLAERLGVVQSTVSKKKDKGNERFKPWSKSLDPDKISWEYRGDKIDDFKFFPIV